MIYVLLNNFLKLFTSASDSNNTPKCDPKNKSISRSLLCGIIPLPIKTGWWQDLNLKDRICQPCDSGEVED